MGLFDIFKKKKTEEKVIESPEFKETDLIEEINKPRDVKDLCVLCNKEIGAERYRKHASKYFHKKCWKKQHIKLKAEGKAF